MAVTVTTDDGIRHVLGGEYLAGGKRALSESEKLRFDSVLQAAAAQVNHYLDSGSGHHAPLAVVQQAIYRLAFFDWHARVVQGDSPTGFIRPHRGSKSPMRQSGTEHLLQPFKARRAGICR